MALFERRGTSFSTLQRDMHALHFSSLLGEQACLQSWLPPLPAAQGRLQCLGLLTAYYLSPLSIHCFVGMSHCCFATPTASCLFYTWGTLHALPLMKTGSGIQEVRRHETG